MTDNNTSTIDATTVPAPQAAEPAINPSKPDDFPDAKSNGTVTTSDTAPTPGQDTAQNEGSSTYSANTVAAISSLINNESPLFKSEDENSSTSTLATSNKRDKNYDFTVSDRATAIMSVYRDYLYEGLDNNVQTINQAGQETPSKQPLMVREGNGQLLLLQGDLNNIKIDRSTVGAQTDTLRHGQQIFTPQDLRKEEIKLAALEKFCAEGAKEKNKHKKKKKKKHSSVDSKSSASTSGSTLSRSTTSKSANSISTSKQTAASTTAAFRLKADVALRTVSNATTTVIHKATAASRTASEVLKTKYRDSTVDIDHIQDEINNDYDFKNYDYDGGGGLAPPSTGLEGYMEDMEYGISPLGDKGLVFRGHDDDEDISFRDICNDLGVTRASHPNLDRFNAKKSYKYPVFRSKKFRKALCYSGIVMLVGMIVVSIASAVTNGFEDAVFRRKHFPDSLPDYETDEEWREHQKEEWEEEHGEKYTGYNNVAVMVPDASNGNNVEDVMPPPPTSTHDQTLQSVSAAYRPIWFDRSTGWNGQTYQEALDFCATYSDYIPCPYEVYCPLNKELIAGVMDSDGESWSPVINMNNEWVQVGSEKQCELYTEKYGKAPEWGLDGQNNEVITRHIMCCRRYPHEEGTTWTPPNQPGSAGNDYVHKPVSSTETEGATESNNSAESSMAIDSEANVGIESGNTAINESKSDSISSSNGSSSNSIAAAEGLSSMTEWEIQVQTVHHPAWFSDEFGWEGTTYSDAEAFCESIPHGTSTLELCPLQAYCPNGPRDEKPLYLQMDAFEGEQWAPIKYDTSNEWIMVGMLSKDPSSTCRTYTQLHHKEPSWGIDGSNVNIKKYILCCERFDNQIGYNALLEVEGFAATDNAPTDQDTSNNSGGSSSTGDNQVELGSSSSESSVVIETEWGEADNSSSNQNFDNDNVLNAIFSTFDPLWLDSEFGWNGGSHANALQFCNKFKGEGGKSMELCPYAAYCPYGPSNPVISGLQSNFDVEGEQWAPVYGQENHWVLITRKGNNLSTSCLTYTQLYDEMPSWGLDDSNKELKQHIMCCSPIQ